MVIFLKEENSNFMLKRLNQEKNDPLSLILFLSNIYLFLFNELFVLYGVSSSPYFLILLFTFFTISELLYFRFLSTLVEELFIDLQVFQVIYSAKLANLDQSFSVLQN